MPLRCAAALLLLGALAACEDRGGAEEVVRQNLRDPDSARFGYFYYNETTKRACMTVNAKTGMGGYSGNKQVQLVRESYGWRWVGEADVSAEGCQLGFADTLN